jgi:hypothetical protein
MWYMKQTTKACKKSLDIEMQNRFDARLPRPHLWEALWTFLPSFPLLFFFSCVFFFLFHPFPTHHSLPERRGCRACCATGFGCCLSSPAASVGPRLACGPASCCWWKFVLWVLAVRAHPYRTADPVIFVSGHSVSCDNFSVFGYLSSVIVDLTGNSLRYPSPSRSCATRKCRPDEHGECVRKPLNDGFFATSVWKWTHRLSHQCGMSAGMRCMLVAWRKRGCKSEYVVCGHPIWLWTANVTGWNHGIRSLWWTGGLAVLATGVLGLAFYSIEATFARVLTSLFS